MANDVTQITLNAASDRLNSLLSKHAKASASSAEFPSGEIFVSPSSRDTLRNSCSVNEIHSFCFERVNFVLQADVTILQ